MSSVRITCVETFVLSERQALVRIGTDAGVVGWGEAVAENWARPTSATVDRLAPLLIGEDPRRITHLWQAMSRGGFYRGGPLIGSAVAGIDQALWDIRGRLLDAPIHELLGGPTRDSVAVYAHAGMSVDGDYLSDGTLNRAHELAAAGYPLLKVTVGNEPVGFIEGVEWLEQLLARLRQLRTAVGNGVALAADFHGRLSVAQSRRTLGGLEGAGLCFVEEPLRPEHSALIGDIVRSTSIPIATGERLYQRTEFRPVLEAGVAIVQPDVSHAGGITETFRIAAQAEVYDASIAPHCPLGPVALAACLQVDLAVPNFYLQEQVLDLHRDRPPGLEIVGNPEVLRAVDGAVPRLTGPGLGIDIDEDAVRARVATGALAPGSPQWRHPDGSFAEW